MEQIVPPQMTRFRSPSKLLDQDPFLESSCETFAFRRTFAIEDDRSLHFLSARFGDNEPAPASRFGDSSQSQKLYKYLIREKGNCETDRWPMLTHVGRGL
jgi:hypothetical protein